MRPAQPYLYPAAYMDRQCLCLTLFSWLCSCPESVVAAIPRNAQENSVLSYSFPPNTMSGSPAQLSPQELEALLNGPAGPPPPGLRPNFDDPANLNGLVFMTLTLCLVFATSAILMRTYTKLFLIRSWGYEDCKLFGIMFPPHVYQG